MLAAVVLTYRHFGTSEFATLLAAAGELRAAGAGAVPAAVDWIGGLLVFAALLKSAQFPFHSWLPDTMETPTPVSALMHAGIINAGGILVLRLSPLVSLSDAAMLTLCVVGGFTAVFASTVMLTQASIKRGLAFSTVAQLGFMMLECGLGAFPLALLHLVGHSLYKAHAFLSSGSTVAAKPVVSPRPPLPIVAGCVAAAWRDEPRQCAGGGDRPAGATGVARDLLHRHRADAVECGRQFRWSLAHAAGSAERRQHHPVVPRAEGAAGLVIPPLQSNAQGVGMAVAALLLAAAISPEAKRHCWRGSRFGPPKLCARPEWLL